MKELTKNEPDLTNRLLSTARAMTSLIIVAHTNLRESFVLFIPATNSFLIGSYSNCKSDEY